MNSRKNRQFSSTVEIEIAAKKERALFVFLKW